MVQAILSNPANRQDRLATVQAIERELSLHGRGSLIRLFSYKFESVEMAQSLVGCKQKGAIVELIAHESYEHRTQKDIALQQTCLNQLRDAGIPIEPCYSPADRVHAQHVKMLTTKCGERTRVILNAANFTDHPDQTYCALTLFDETSAYDYCDAHWLKYKSLLAEHDGRASSWPKAQPLLLNGMEICFTPSTIHSYFERFFSSLNKADELFVSMPRWTKGGTVLAELLAQKVNTGTQTHIISDEDKFDKSTIDLLASAGAAINFCQYRCTRFMLSRNANSSRIMLFTSNIDQYPDTHLEFVYITDDPLIISVYMSVWDEMRSNSKSLQTLFNKTSNNCEHDAPNFL